MARGLILKVEYTDINDKHQNRVEVWQEGYTGETLVRDGLASPFVIEWGDSSGQDFPIIYGSTATLKFYQSAAREFQSFFSADNRKNLVKHYKDDILFWTGYGIADTWEEDPNDPCHEAEFTSCDGLGLLSDLDFVDSEGDAYTGWKTIRQIIDILLIEKTGLDLDLYYGIDWVNNLALDYLALYKDCASFEEMTCGEVLEDILRGCRVFQRHGKWFVVSYSNWSKDQFYMTVPSALIDDYLSGDFAPGDFLTRVVGMGDTYLIVPTTSDFWFENKTNIEFLPALKKITLIEDFGYVDTLIKNGGFLPGDEDWIVNGLTMWIRFYDEDSYYAFLAGKDLPANPEQISKYITQSIAGIKTGSNQLRVKFGYALNGATDEVCELYVKIILRNSDPEGDDYYAQYQYQAYPEEIMLTWSTTDSALKLGAKLGGGAIEYDDIKAKSLTNVPDGFKTFNHNFTNIPADGTLELYLLAAYTDNANIAGPCFREVSLELAGSTGDNLPDSRDITVINNELNNLTDDDIDSVIGDYPSTVENAVLAYRCGFLNQYGSLTTGWKLTGATSYEFNEFRGRFLASLKRSPRQNYQCRAADMVPDIKMVIIDEDNDDIKLLENGISYDDAMMTCEGQYTEILAVDLETGQAGAFTVNKTDNY